MAFTHGTHEPHICRHRHYSTRVLHNFEVLFLVQVVHEPTLGDQKQGSFIRYQPPKKFCNVAKSPKMRFFKS